MEEHNFLIRVQELEKSIDEFMTSLENLSLFCELDNLREGLFPNMFIVGLNITNHQIKKQLLQGEDLKVTT